nr:pentatricopeptide repeat-containing protein [Tanacetum cinerariifolium]
MNLLEYLSQAITYDMDDLGVEARNSNIYSVEARTRTKDKGKEKVSQDASDGVETRRCTIKVDTETEYESDDDSDYQSDKSVDYLSPGEDELFELRNLMKANRKEKAKEKDKPYSGMNEPNEENSMPVDNVRGKTFEEHNIYMNELLKSLKTADKDRITEDPFSFVEKHMERYPMHDETTHWRLRKPKFLFVASKEWRRKGGSKVWTKTTLSVCSRERWMTAEKTFQCISLVDQHTCVSNFNFGALINYKWIAKIFGDKIRANLNIRKGGLCQLGIKGKRTWGGRGVVWYCSVWAFATAGSRGGASGSISRGVGGSGDASRSKGRCTAGSRGGASGSRGRGADGSKKKHVSTAGTKKRQEKTQVEPQQTQHEPDQTQVEDQIKQTEDQAEIDLTQVKQTQKQTQEQVQPQEQP